MEITKACRDINELDANTRVACETFISKCKSVGLNVLVTETYRSQDRQNYLYCQGRTIDQCVKAGISRQFAEKHCRVNEKQVTWTLESNHTGRRAFDICKNIAGQEYDDDKFFADCAKIAKDLGITAGYYWTNPQDRPHMELAAGKEVKQDMIIKQDIFISENGKETKIQLDAVNVQDKNYVGLRDIVSALGYTTDYDSTSKKITIRK